MIFTQAEAANYLKIHYEHLGALRRRGAGPPCFYLGRFIRYRKEELDAWIDARLRKVA